MTKENDIGYEKANQMKSKNLFVIASGMSLNAWASDQVSGSPMAGNSS